MNKISIDLDRLYFEYFINLKTVDKCSKIFGCSKTTLFRYIQTKMKSFFESESGFKLACARCRKNKISKTKSSVSEEEIKSINKKRYNTNMQIYGVNIASKLPEVKDKMAKTNINKYGGVAPACSTLVQNKMKTTINLKYGVNNIFQRSDLMKTVYLSKFHTTHPMKDKVIYDKMVNTIQRKYNVRYIASTIYKKH